MKTFYFIPLMFLTACSTAPKLALRPQPPPPAVDNSAVRYPEVVRAYHVGRYADPNDDLVMHEQHVVYRVEENTRWDLRPANAGGDVFFPAVPSPRDAAFSPLPVNDAVLAEVNAQKLATVQIMVQAQNPVGGAGAVSSRVATDQNQFAGNGGAARLGDSNEKAAGRARNRAGAAAAIAEFPDQ